MDVGKASMRPGTRSSEPSHTLSPRRLILLGMESTVLPSHHSGLYLTFLSSQSHLFGQPARSYYFSELQSWELSEKGLS